MGAYGRVGTRICGVALGRLLLSALVAWLLTGGLAIGPASAVPRGQSGCSVASASDRTFVIDGVARSFDIRIPAGAGATTAMVMSLHGVFSSASDQQTLSALSAEGPGVNVAQQSLVAAMATEALGRQEGFIALFPNAAAGQWDLAIDGTDVRFLAALTQWLHERGCSNPSATSVNGFSMGAMMASRLICSAPHLFSGLGLVSGVYPPTPGCHLPSTTSVVGVHSTADWIVPWSGQMWPNLVELGMESFPYNRAEMLHMWSHVKGCGAPVRATVFVIAIDDYSGCDGGSVHMVTIVGGDHTWDFYSFDTSQYLWSVLRPEARHPVRSGAQALAQALPPDPVTGVVRQVDSGSVIAVDAGVRSASVLGTLTVTAGRATGYVTAFPCEEKLPLASNVNFAPLQSVASGVMVRTGGDGRFCLYQSAPVHLVWDQVAETALPGHAPQRRLDTREVYGVAAPPVAGSVVGVQAGLPNATVVGTLTVTGGYGAGFAVAYPCDEALPLASNVNFAALQSVASGVVVRTDANGRFCVFVSNSVHVVWDQVAETDLPSHAPVRKVDTRAPNGGGALPAAGSVIEVDAGVPNSSVLGTLTVTGGVGNGFAVAYPCSETTPLASNVNFGVLQSVATGALVRTDAAGRFCVYVSNSVHVVWDQVAETDLPGHTPVRRLDTRAVTQS